MMRSLELRAKRMAVADARRMYDDACRDDDFLGVLQLKGRPERLEAELSVLEAQSDDIGEVVLDFGYGALHGLFGVDLDFVTRALDAYRHVLAAWVQWPSDSGEALRMRATVAGDLGFILREKERPAGYGPSTIPLAIHRVANVITCVGSASAEWPDTESEFDERRLAALQAFLVVLDDVEASMTMIEGEYEHRFSVDTIHRAAMRTQDQSRLDELGLLCAATRPNNAFANATGSA